MSWLVGFIIFAVLFGIAVVFVLKRKDSTGNATFVIPERFTDQTGSQASPPSTTTDSDSKLVEFTNVKIPPVFRDGVVKNVTLVNGKTKTISTVTKLILTRNDATQHVRFAMLAKLQLHLFIPPQNDVVIGNGQVLESKHVLVPQTQHLEPNKGADRAFIELYIDPHDKALYLEYSYGKSKQAPARYCFGTRAYNYMQSQPDGSLPIYMRIAGADSFSRNKADVGLYMPAKHQQ